MLVEPTRSQNSTVMCRRSPTASATGATVSVGADGWAGAAVTEEVCPLPSLRSTAMASRILRRCPTIETPRSFRSSVVRLGRTVSSISFSRNAASYFPRPRLRSQTTTSITAPPNSGLLHIIVPSGGSVQEASGYAVSGRLDKFGLGTTMRCRFRCQHLSGPDAPPLCPTGFSQHEIFEGKLSFACRERSTAVPTGDFPIRGLRSAFYFDNLIKRFAVLTKIQCGRHKTPHTNQCVP